MLFMGLFDQGESVIFDFAKRLIDHGVHPPTLVGAGCVYFPGHLHDAMLVEPTETETRESLDWMIEKFLRTAREALEDPELIRTAPHTCEIGKIPPSGVPKSLLGRSACGGQRRRQLGLEQSTGARILIEEHGWDRIPVDGKPHEHAFASASSGCPAGELPARDAARPGVTSTSALLIQDKSRDSGLPTARQARTRPIPTPLPREGEAP